MVSVNLTDRCNQQCIYCEIGAGIPSAGQDLLNIDDMKWIIGEMAKARISKLSLCGGEPFLFDDLMATVRYAGERRIRCSITTNGMTAFHLSDSELEILKRHKAEINISLDSFDEEILHTTRGDRAALRNALRSIHRLQDFGIPLTILTVITRYNYTNLLSTVKTACDNGISQVLFQPVIFFSNYPDRVGLEKKRQFNVPKERTKALIEQLEEILAFEKRNNIKTNVYRIYPWIGHYLRQAGKRDDNRFFESVLRKFHCREIYAIIEISYTGGIQPCGLRPATISIQDHRTGSLTELWEKATRKIRKDMENGNYYPECNGCCHHFSRNMLASMMKHPFENRDACMKMAPLILSRIRQVIWKRTLFGRSLN